MVPAFMLRGQCSTTDRHSRSTMPWISYCPNEPWLAWMLDLEVLNPCFAHLRCSQGNQTPIAKMKRLLSIHSGRNERNLWLAPLEMFSVIYITWKVGNIFVILTVDLKVHHGLRLVLIKKWKYKGLWLSVVILRRYLSWVKQMEVDGGVS